MGVRSMRAAWRDAAIVVSASTAARAASLFFLVAAGFALGEGSVSTIVYALATSVAVGTLLDPQAQPMLIVDADNTGAVDRGLWRGAVRLQILSSVLTACLASGITFAVARPGGDLAVLCLAISVAAGGEQFSRFRRTPWQLQRRYTMFATVDLFVSGGRFAAAGIFFTGMKPVMPSVILILFTFMSVLVALRARPGLRLGEEVGVRAAFCRCLPYGAATLASSFYSQLPAVVLGVFGSVQSAATIGFLTRLTQPPEIAAMGIATVGTERLCAAQTPTQTDAIGRKMVKAAGAIGILMAACVLAAVGPVADLANVHDAELFTVAMVLSAGMIPKFISHQLVARAVAAGQVNSRMKASIACAVLCLATVTACARLGPLAVAVGMFSSELVLLRLLGSVVKKASRNRPTGFGANTEIQFRAA